LKQNKVSHLSGHGKITGANEVTVLKADGSSETVKTKHIIIATGSEPSPLPGNTIPIDEKFVVSSTGAIALDKIPKKMVIIGGGVIGLEIGSVYRRLGTEVTVVEYMDRICSTMDVELTTMFKKLLEK